MICVCFSFSLGVNIGLAAELDVWTVYRPSSFVKRLWSGGVVIGDVLSGRTLGLGLCFYPLFIRFRLLPYTWDGLSDSALDNGRCVEWNVLVHTPDNDGRTWFVILDELRVHQKRLHSPHQRFTINWHNLRV